MAGYKSSSGDEDDERSLGLAHHKFSQPDHVKMVLKSEALKLRVMYFVVYAEKAVIATRRFFRNVPKFLSQ